MADNKKIAIMACRVSTNKQAQEGESLDTQEGICHSIADKLNAEVVKIWRESYSGRKDDRVVLKEILEYVKNNKGKIDYFIFRDIDRLTRAGSSVYWEIKNIMTACGVTMIDSYGLIQPVQNTLEHLGFEYKWSKFSPSDMAESLKADMSKDEVRVILTRLIGREIELDNDGYQVRESSDGFLNKQIEESNGKKKTIQVPDPDRMNFYITMFELRASGKYSDEEIVEKINSMGFRSRIRRKWNKGHELIIGTRGGVKLVIKQLQRIIQRPIYCGIRCTEWTKYMPVKTKYDGLVSIDIFNRANRGKVFVNELADGRYEILYDQKPVKTKTKKNKNNPAFPFKNVILCPHCLRPFKASFSKGKSGSKFPFYHCGSNSGPRCHQYIGFPKSEFEENVKNFIRSIAPSAKFMSVFEVAVINVWRSRQSDKLKEIVEMNNVIASLYTKKNHLVELLIGTQSLAVRLEYEKRLEEIDADIRTKEKFRSKNELTEQQIQKFLEMARYLVEHLEELLIDSENIYRQQALFGLVFEKLPTYEEILNRTPKLSLVFEQKEIPHNEKSPLVIRLGIEPRTISLKGCCSTS